MGGMMMMGGGVMGGEGGQGYGKQNPYAYGTPQRLEPPTPRPTHPMRQGPHPLPYYLVAGKELQPHVT